jgi:NAD(P)-dependent dehydrogenase (short-subunit alcohol dehydrogenase family)
VNRRHELGGRTVLVTGASSGIGRAAAVALAGQGARVLMACRDRARGETARREAVERSGNGQVELLLADLAVQADVRRLAADVRARGALHVLVNNAGIIAPRRELGPDGIELTWATNVLACWLLAEELGDVLRAGAPARIVNVASELAGGLDLADVEFRRRPYTGVSAYAQSKQADRMLTWVLARRLGDSGVTANALHPGTVATPLLARASGRSGAAAAAWARAVGRTPEEGADTLVWLAGSVDVAGVSGEYWIDRRKVRCRFRDEPGEERLWELCRQMTAG